MHGGMWWWKAEQASEAAVEACQNGEEATGEVQGRGKKGVSRCHLVRKRRSPAERGLCGT